MKDQRHDHHDEAAEGLLLASRHTRPGRGTGALLVEVWLPVRFEIVAIAHTAGWCSPICVIRSNMKNGWPCITMTYWKLWFVTFVIAMIAMFSGWVPKSWAQWLSAPWYLGLWEQGWYGAGKR